MRFNRIGSLFLTAVFLLLFSIPASASSVVYSDTLSFETAITEYANSTIATIFGFPSNLMPFTPTNSHKE